MKVSIVIPVYNVESYLEECIDSIYNQTYKDFEVIAIDDGSTDGSLEILMNYKNKYSNFYVYTQPNKGLGATRNIGLFYSTGEFVYFLDSDDVIEPTMLEECVIAISNYDAEVVGFQATIFGDIEGKNKNQYIYSHRCGEMNTLMTGDYFFMKYRKKISLLNTPLLFFKKDFLEKNKLHFLEGVLHEDVDFYYNLISCCSKLILLDKNLYRRRYRAASIMMSETTNGLQRRLDLIRIYKGIVDIDVCEDLRSLYLYISLKGIRNVIEKMISCDEDIVSISTMLEVFYNDIYERVSEANLLTMGEYFLGQIAISDVNKKTINSAILAIIKNKLNHVFDKTGLYRVDKLVGIYGIGDVTKKFLKICKIVEGMIPENIIFIETNTNNQVRTYNGKIVKDCKDINFSELFSVIISSELYDEEIETSIRKIDSNICLYKIATDF